MVRAFRRFDRMHPVGGDAIRVLAGLTVVTLVGWQEVWLLGIGKFVVSLFETFFAHQ